ncbi:MAG: hypothetical protein WC136_09185 [Sphaerochaeta sp.]|jgi:hypothetical protein
MLVSTYYIDFLKSFKHFLSSHFPQIKHYQFNYADKTFLNWKLYNEDVYEFPLCIINFNDIRIDQNADFFRSVSHMMARPIVQTLCVNHTIRDTVVMDFKWVTISMGVKINFNSSNDLLDYHNYLITTFPKNFWFYAYKYTTFLDVDQVTKDWELDHDTEGLYYKTYDKAIKKYATYKLEPMLRIQSITKNKQVEQQNSLQIEFEGFLKIPNMISNQTQNNNIINGIQIIINSQGESLPILIDMNDNIISDTKQKLFANILIDQNNFENNQLIIPSHITKALNGKKAVIYLVSDSTSSDPIIIYEELGIILSSDVDLKFDVPIQDYQFNVLNNNQLLIFN